jgi:uncharacterized protein YozE (UPF0346 family)
MRKVTGCFLDNFKTWLINKYYIEPHKLGLCVGSPINDLANDVYCDSGFPKTISLEKVKRYLKSKNACDEAMDALFEASIYYTEYKNAKKWAKTLKQL